MIFTIKILKENLNYKLKKKYVDFLITNCKFWIKSISYNNSKKDTENIVLSGAKINFVNFSDFDKRYE